MFARHGGCLCGTVSTTQVALCSSVIAAGTVARLVPLHWHAVRFASRREAQARTVPCPFRRLDLPATASRDDVKNRYHELAKIHHPDVGGDEERFKSINEAYQDCLDSLDQGGVAPPADADTPSAGGAATASGGGSDGQKEYDDFRYDDDGGGGPDPGHDDHRWDDTFRDRYRRARKMSYDDKRDEYQRRFSLLSDTDAIERLFHEAMSCGDFVGYDVGEPLFLALQRFHVAVGLGDMHLQRCFSLMDSWELYTHHTPSCTYYHVMLQLYCNEEILAAFQLDASTATEMVARIMQRMHDKGVADESAINWWETLRLALMGRFNY